MEILKLLPEAEAVTWTKAKLGKRGTIANLMKLTGIQTGSAVCRSLNQLYDEGLAHIGRWNRTTKAPAAVWVQGKGVHAPTPEPECSKVKNRRYRANIARAIANGRAGKPYDKRYNKHVAVAIAADTVARTSVAPVTWLSALVA
jgi:hypothetical protein